MAIDRDWAVMYRRSEDSQPEVHVSRHDLTFMTSADEVQAVPLPPEIGVTLELVDRTDFRASAASLDLRQSARFYFAGPSPSPWESRLEQADDLFFYVRTPTGRIFKVGVTRMHTATSTKRLRVGGVLRHVPTEMVTVLWADLGDDVGSVEPRVAPVRAPWFGDSTEILVGDARRVAVALEAAVRRGDVEDGDSARRWLAELDAASSMAPVEPFQPASREFR
jgi:hypothetical protein